MALTYKVVGIQKVNGPTTTLRLEKTGSVEYKNVGRFERLPQTSEAFLYIAMIRLMLKRLAQFWYGFLGLHAT